jgi:hypothetical protein
MLSANQSHARSPVFPVSFEFKPNAYGTNPLQHESDYNSRPIGHYALTINDWPVSQGWAYLDDADGELLSWPCPQWPWVLGQCCLMGDINPTIARIRLELLIDTIRCFADRSNFNLFVTPPFSTKFEIAWAGMDSWMRMMYLVTSEIRSRFSSPCKSIRKRYGNLE